MNSSELYDKLVVLSGDAFIGSEAGNKIIDDAVEYSDYIQKVDAIIERAVPEIQNETADWESGQWEELFYLYIDAGDPEISAYIINRIAEACGDDFFAKRIEENAECLRNDVYSNSDDKKALRESDILFAAVKSLNHIKANSANDAVIKAFDICNPVNDHIVYELSEYISRACTDKIPGYIEDTELSFDKMSTLLSMYVSQDKREDAIYQAIKRRFKAMSDGSDDKNMVAMILGDYGEPNAILILRKYVKKLMDIYMKNQDRELFSNIMMISSAIEALGGSADDLLE